MSIKNLLKGILDCNEKEKEESEKVCFISWKTLFKPSLLFLLIKVQEGRAAKPLLLINLRWPLTGLIPLLLVSPPLCQLFHLSRVWLPFSAEFCLYNSLSSTAVDDLFSSSSHMIS